MLSTLETLFSSAARVEVLRLFLLNSGRQYYQREIERETGQPIRAVQREVKRLVEAGLLLDSAEGNRVFYRLNPESPLLPELTALFQKAAGAGGMAEPAEGPRPTPLEPLATEQPFEWMETPEVPSLPGSLRRSQVEGEWDQAY